MATDEESFERLAAGQEDREPNVEASGRSHGMGKNLSTYFHDWLIDPARQPGEMGVVKGYDGYYAIFFVGRDDNSYTMKQVRHILVKAGATEDGEYTDEAKEIAKEMAVEYLAEWKAGEATEESFEELAKEVSEDTSASENGGLYDQVVRHALVEGIENFAFDESREPGDTDVVYGESSSYAGYHVVYFVGEGERYDRYIAESEQRTTDSTNWENENIAGYEAVTGYSYRFVK